MSTAVSPTEAGVTVGSFFVCSWGYDQTNVDFYKVVALTPKGVKVQRWQSKLDRSNGPADYVVPGDGPWSQRRLLRDDDGQPLFSDTPPYDRLTETETAPVQTKRLTQFGPGTVYISINSYSSAYLWNGSPNYQTASGWGH